MSGRRYGSLIERLLFLSVLDPVTECWVWIGARHRKGYGRITMRVPEKNHPVPFYAHRVAYEELTGKKIPPGFQLDHTCRYTSCINPAHLEPVPAITNRERQMLSRYEEELPEHRLWVPESVYWRELEMAA